MDTKSPLKEMGNSLCIITVKVTSIESWLIITSIVRNQAETVILCKLLLFIFWSPQSSTVKRVSNNCKGIIVRKTILVVKLGIISILSTESKKEKNSVSFNFSYRLVIFLRVVRFCIVFSMYLQGHNGTQRNEIKQTFV